MSPSWKTPELDRNLHALHVPGPERGGVVLSDGSIVEMTNFGDDPTDTCVLDPIEILEVEDRMVATWHTHPTSSSELSGMDWETFTQWPDMMHVIIGTDGPRWYAVKGQAVVNAA